MVFRVSHIERQIPPLAHTSMYNWHKYWARKTWNVVGEFVESYCPPGGVVLDPFAGSGVVGIEAVRRGRRAILVDIVPLMEEIVWATLVDVDVDKLRGAFEKIKANVESTIQCLYLTRCPNCGTEQSSLANVWEDGFLTRLRYVCVNRNCGERYAKGAPVAPADLELLDSVKQRLGEFWFPSQALEYPEGQPFLKREKYLTLADVFTERNLYALSILMDAINHESNPRLRRILKAGFTSMVHLASRMCPALDPGPGNHQTAFSSTWNQQSYWSVPKALEQNVWKLFQSAIAGHQGILRAKRESAEIFQTPVRFASSVDEVLAGEADIYLHTGSSTAFAKRIPDEAIDYVFTDPPYDASIQYGELAFLWVSWLKKDTGYLKRLMQSEVVRNERQHKSSAVYQGLLRESFEKMFATLQPEGYLTVTFHNPSLSVRKATIEAGTFAGFRFEKIHHQPTAVRSAKSLLQPFGSAQGDFYLRFRKPHDPMIGVSPSKQDDDRFELIVVETTTAIIAERGEPTPYTMIINKIDPELAKRGFFSSLTTGLDVKGVLQKHLGIEFELVKASLGNAEGDLWWFAYPEIIPHPEIPLSERVEETVLRRLKAKGTVDFTDVWEAVSVEFPNSLTPDTTSIQDALKANARKVPGGRWMLKDEVSTRENQHNEVIAVLGEIGAAWGYEVWVGKKEQSALVSGTGTTQRKLSTLVTGDLAPFAEVIADLKTAQQLDCVWIGPSGPVACFEVEATTSMTSGLLRGSNLLGTVRRYLVIPEERRAELDRKLRSPLFKERFEGDEWVVLNFDYLRQSARKLVGQRGRFDLLEGSVEGEPVKKDALIKQMSMELDE